MAINIKVRVTAGARKESFIEVVPGSFEIAVKEEAEANRANARVRELIALRFVVDVKHVRITKGHRSPSKTLSIHTRSS